MVEATNVSGHWPGSGGLLEGIPDGWYTRGTAAKMCGRSRDTLKRWAHDGTFSPSGYTKRGELTVWLYSDEDVEELIRIASQKKAGRPRATVEEVADAPGN